VYSADNHVVAKYLALKERFAARESAMKLVNAVRRGDTDEAFAGKYSGEWPKPITANTIDVAARDLAEMLAPLPTFTCSSQNVASEPQRKQAEIRTMIVNNYVNQSSLQTQMFSGCDQLATYGYLPFVVEIDVEKKMPRIKLDNPMGAYYEKDRQGNITVYARRYEKTIGELCAEFPELSEHIRVEKKDWTGRLISAPDTAKLEVVYFSDANAFTLFLPERRNLTLRRIGNPLGRCPVVVAERKGLDDEVRGQFDDVVWVQLARDKFSALALEAATKAVEAPLAVPMDTQELALGPDAIVRSNTPEKIRRVPIEMPASAFSQDQVLANELRVGSRYPESRTGNMDASIVTGQGVKALNLGFDSQLKAYQSHLADALKRTLCMAFEMDEALWPNVEKSATWNDRGTPYNLKYTPSKHINGNHEVDVQYGLMAGLDPNRALVFGLQARSDKLISRDTLMRNLPMNVNVDQENAVIAIEELRDALGQGLAATAQSIPAMAQMGQDPLTVVTQIAQVIQDFRKGTPIEEAAIAAFTPPEPPPGMNPSEPAPATAGAPGSEPGSGGLPPGMEASGLPEGVAPGQAAMGPGGRPDLSYILSGLSAGGQPQMTANVVRRRPV
jgi:hypothetical protein